MTVEERRTAVMKYAETHNEHQIMEDTRELVRNINTLIQSIESLIENSPCADVVKLGAVCSVGLGKGPTAYAEIGNVYGIAQAYKYTDKKFGIFKDENPDALSGKYEDADYTRVWED